MQVQGRKNNPLLAVAGITAAALALVGMLGWQAAQSAPDSRSPAAKPSAGSPRAPNPVAQRQPVTSNTLPAGTGTGRRVVYALGIRRVWVVAGDGQVRRTYQVPRGQPRLAAGIYRISTRQATVPAPDGENRYRYVLRMEAGKGGASSLGFCSVLLTRSGKPAAAPTDSAKQGGVETGKSACIRQKIADARFLWKATRVGTTVYVVP